MTTPTYTPFGGLAHFPDARPPEAALAVNRLQRLVHLLEAPPRPPLTEDVLRAAGFLTERPVPPPLTFAEMMAVVERRR